MNWFRRLCLRIALGDDYDYMLRTLQGDARMTRAHTVNVVVRKDGVERHIEADWLKRLARLVANEKPGPIGGEVTRKRSWIDPIHDNLPLFLLKILAMILAMLPFLFLVVMLMVRYVFTPIMQVVF